MKVEYDCLLGSGPLIFSSKVEVGVYSSEAENSADEQYIFPLSAENFLIKPFEVNLYLGDHRKCY